MAVSIVSRPIGHKLATTQISGSITDSSGDAVVYVPGGHSLSDGDYIYIESNFDSYNGFKYVDSIAYDHFKLKDSEGGSYVPFKQNADIDFYISVLDHGYQCVHLPIVYELESDLWPINESAEAYTPITIISVTDNNGYTQLELSTGLTDPLTLEYIELVGEGSLAGPYQIIDVLYNWSIVINLAYDATNDFSGYQIVKYYNNYAIRVEVYGGYATDNPWSTEKPFVLLSTLSFIPDSTGKIKFSIAEILKSQITTRNNLTLDTLPNNTDFTTNFYIKYYESYDVSDEVNITTFNDNVTDDSQNFIGMAINAKMPFKSLNMGHLSDYVEGGGNLARWLTLQDRPIAFVGLFFDLSFINQFAATDIVITIFKASDGIVTETEIIEISDPGVGIIRVPLTPETGFDEYCLQASTTGVAASGGDTSSISIPALSTGVNIAGPNTNWSAGANPSVTLPAPDPTTTVRSDVWAIGYSFIEGNTYTITPVQIDYSFGANTTTRRINFVVLDSGNNILFQYNSGSLSQIGTFTTPATFVAPAGAIKFGYYVTVYNILANAGSTVTIFSLSGITTTPIIPAVAAQNVTEQICIDIVEDCNTFINDDLRLTEGAQYRELE